MLVEAISSTIHNLNFYAKSFRNQTQRNERKKQGKWENERFKSSDTPNTNTNYLRR